MGVSRFLTSVLNFCVVLLSLAVTAAGIWLSTRSDGGACIRFLQYPIIIIGVAMFIVSIAGLIGSWKGIALLLWIYAAVMFIGMILLLAFTVFAFIVTNARAGEVISNQGFRNYRLADYSSWLQEQVNKDKYWTHIRSCIYDFGMCNDLSKKYPNETALYAANLSPVQAGCCLPPLSCGFTFENATTFIKPITSLPPPPAAASPSSATSNSTSDCDRYLDAPSELCFSCDSCKAGVLQLVKSDWRKVAVVNLIAVLGVFIVYSLGCCAYRSSKRPLGFVRGFDV